MAAVIIRLRVFIVDIRYSGERFVAAFPQDRLGDLVARLLVEVGIEDNPKKWDLLNDDAVLPPERTVGELIAISPPTNGLMLRKLSASDSGTGLSSIFGNTFDIPMTNDASQSGSLAISVADSDKLNPPVEGDNPDSGETTPLRENNAAEVERMAAIAEKKSMAFVDLTGMEIPLSIIALVPESVARENIVIPLSLFGNTLRVATANPDDNYETVQKLQFILNKDIVPVLATKGQILEAIDRYYGESETESVDSMLVEFTDTAIEFTRTEARPSAPGGAAPPAPAAAPPETGEGEIFETDFEIPAMADPPASGAAKFDDADLDEESIAAPPKDETVFKGVDRQTQAPAPDSLPQPAPMAPGTSRSAVPPVTRSAPAQTPGSKPKFGSLTPPTAPAKPKKMAESGGFAQQDTSGKAKSTTERRATVRYYSRMNPDRVVPLLVMLTRHEVEEIIKKHVEQRATGPLTISKDVPIEIEPVLPGCQCHPPKVTTLLGASDDVFTFHIVPHVLGEVTGARVLIRQDHKMLAEIALDMRVVQRTLVVASGLSTFVVPAASALMKRTGIDLSPKDGSDPYIAVLNFLFGEVSPVLLTAVLAAVTVGLYLYTRPKGRDVFFDISTKPAK